MTFDSHCYQTESGIFVSRDVTEIPLHNSLDDILSELNTQLGGLLVSSYEYPGRYKRWALGFINPPIELSTCEDTFKITVRNDRGLVLLPHLADRFYNHPHFQFVHLEKHEITGSIRPSDRIFLKKNAASSLLHLQLFERF
jgi:anthranilate synthase